MRLLLATSLAIVMATAALAQQTGQPQPGSSQLPGQSQSPGGASSPGGQTSQAAPMSTLPANSLATNKAAIYDPTTNAKIGEVTDVLLTPQGNATALIIRIGDRDVAIPFSGVQHSNNKLTISAPASSLANAPGFRFDTSTSTWLPVSAGK